ncbi:MAG: hypothetical protein Q9191_005714 [Dirinaria sp. TL-2023a]
MDRLPVELLSQLVSYLGIEDFRNLKLTNNRLHITLQDERVSKTVVQKNVKYSVEAKLADEGLSSYSTALRRLDSTRTALASAQPNSVLLLGYGSSFAYRDGILCYIYKSTIRILDVFKAATKELVIDTYQLHDPEQHPRFPQKLLNFQAGVLSFFYEPMENLVNFIMLININELRNRTTPSPTIMETHALWAMGPHEPQRVFARNNSQIFCFGKYGRTSLNDRHQWGLRTWSFATQTTSRLLQLEGFFGVDIGQTVAFELFDDYMYAVSNQDTEGIEEIDWTSFYNCYRVPIANLTREHLQHKRIWRRQHRDGVINDLWTDLSLQKDEETGLVTIVEGRKEWLEGRGEQSRTFYRQPLEFTDYDNDESRALSASGSSGSARRAFSTAQTALPPDDVLVGAIDRSNKPQYLPPQYRLPYSVHETMQVRPARHYHPLRTKYRCYNLPASTSLDVASSDENCLNGEPTVHLIMNTRVPSSPIDPVTGRLDPPEIDDDGVAISGSSERYQSRRPESWPPKDAPEQLLELLNTHIRAQQSTRGLEAVSDGRILIYLTDSVDDGLGQAIILINFDARIRFPGLEKLSLRQGAGQTMKRTEPEPDHTVRFSAEAVRDRLDAKKKTAIVWPDRRRMDAIPGMERLLGWQEDAWWCERGRVIGFQLEY